VNLRGLLGGAFACGVGEGRLLGGAFLCACGALGLEFAAQGIAGRGKISHLCADERARVQAETPGVGEERRGGWVSGRYVAVLEGCA